MPDYEDSEHQDPVPAVEQTIKLGAGISVDGYMLHGSDSWEVRYGLDYISVLMGYRENYYRRLTNLRRTKKASKKLESLQSKGYTSYKLPVKVLRDGKRGASIIDTISFDDFSYIVELEAELRNPKAIALLTASFRELLRSRTQAAFGLPEDTLEQKQLSFESAYQLYLQREDLLAEDREDVASLVLPGDEDLEYDILDNILYYPDYSDWDSA